MQKKYKFKLEHEMYNWEHRFITGSQVRELGGGIPESMDLFLKIRGAPGRLVEHDEEIDLANPGLEKFYSQESSSEAGDE